MEQHIVPVKLPGDKKLVKRALVEVGAKASMIEILAATYGETFGGLHRKLAEKLYGEAEIDLVFGVFYEEDKMVFAFCRDVADYNKKTKKVECRDLDEVLVEKVNPIEGIPVRPPIQFPEADMPSRPPGSMPDMMVRYALVEKPEPEEAQTP